VDAGAACPTCPDGSYCNPTTSQCVSCTDLSRFQFGAGTKIGASSGPGNNQVFPRAQSDGQGWRLLYRYTSPTNAANSNIASSPNAPWASGTFPSGGGINTDALESGPLGLAPGTTVPGVAANTYQVLFDRFSSSGSGSGKRSIYAADGIDAGSATVLTGAINQGVDDYHVAYAYQTASPGPNRFYWTSTRPSSTGSVTALRTMPAGGGTVTTVAILMPSGCHSRTQDMAPWITPDGTRLLFHSQEQDQTASCGTPLYSGQQRLYWITVDPSTGAPAGGVKAVDLTGMVGGSGQFQTPSLTPDMCALLYASDGGGSDYDLFQATRN
jgi:hypothetical protein